MSIEAKPYCDAAKLDILNLLSKEEGLGVFEFRQIKTIAEAMELLVDAVGTPTEQGVIRITLDMAEYKAPTLHKALIDRAFDGETLLQRKYQKMLDEHTQVRHAALAVQSARSVLAQERSLVASHKMALKEHEHQLRIERERLQLEAGNAGRTISLPALPQLTSPDEGSDGEPKPGAAWNPDDPDATYKAAEEGALDPDSAEAFERAMDKDD